MSRFVRVAVPGALLVLLGLMVALRAGDPMRSRKGASAATQSILSSDGPIETAPYRRYFSGHWCDCWRKVNMRPIDIEAVYGGVLPRTDTPVWMKHKLIDLKGMDAGEKLLCRTFAGLVNRRSAQWYCIEDGDFWLKGRRRPFNDGIVGPPYKGVWQGGRLGGQQIGLRLGKTSETPYLEGIKRFALELDPPAIDGCILYDPALLDPNAEPEQPRDVLNVVRTMCAIERALPLTPRQYDDLMKRIGDTGKLPIIMDTTQREDWTIGHHHGDEAEAARQIYAWAFNNFWKNQNKERRCLRQALCYMPPLGPSDPEQDITDYVVQWKIFCFYSEGDHNLDEKHMEYILTQSPVNIPVIGQLTHRTGAAAEADRVRLLRLFSRFGKYFVGFEQTPNLSLHSGERPKERFQYRQKPGPEITFNPRKRYVAFCLTGSNSIGHFMNDRAYHWDYVSRGSVPLGWTVPLTAADVVPNIAKYYYKTMTENDCFIGDVGGLGCALPTVWGAGTRDPEAVLAGYYERAAEYMGYLDVSAIWADWLDEERLDNMIQGLPALRGVFYGQAGANRYLDRPGFMRRDVPVIHTYVDVVRNAADLERILPALARATERFCFIGVDETGFSRDEDVVGAIAAVARELGNRFVVVRPDRLTPLYAKAVEAGKAPAGLPKYIADAGVKHLTLRRVRDRAIIVDDRDDDWRGLRATTLFLTRRGKLVSEKPPAEDQAAEVMAAIDSERMYIRARIHDRELVVDDVNLTAGDHLELLLDMRSEPFREPVMTEGFYRLALVPAAGLVRKPMLILQYPTYDVGLINMNQHKIEHELCSVVLKDGYRIEASIPLLNFPYREWKEGDRVAIGFAVIDYAPAAGAATHAASASPLICRPAVVD